MNVDRLCSYFNSRKCQWWLVANKKHYHFLQEELHLSFFFFFFKGFILEDIQAKASICQVLLPLSKSTDGIIWSSQTIQWNSLLISVRKPVYLYLSKKACIMDQTFGLYWSPLHSGSNHRSQLPPSSQYAEFPFRGDVSSVPFLLSPRLHIPIIRKNKIRIRTGWGVRLVMSELWVV